MYHANRSISSCCKTRIVLFCFISCFFFVQDKSSLTRLNDRLSHRCYITSTDVRRYQDADDMNTINCHLLNFDNAPTLTEFIQRVNTFRGK